MSAMDTVRADIVAQALAAVGLHGRELEQLLGPVKGKWDLDRPFKCWKTPEGKWQTQGVSTCGLVAEGIWRAVGVDAAWLYAPYVFGSAIARAIKFARSEGAWRKPGDDRCPRPGDYVVIGSGLQTHALTAVDWEGDILVSVDGGQVGADGLQCVKRCVRAWNPAKNKLGTRSVVGWIDPEFLPYRITPA